MKCRNLQVRFQFLANWTDNDIEIILILDGGKGPVYAEDPDVQFREKVQEVPPSAYAAACTHRTRCQSLWRLHCRGVNLEVAGVPGPQRCLNQTPSKGQKAFAHRLPQGELPPPTQYPGERKTWQRRTRTDTWERGEESQRKQHKKEKRRLGREGGK